MKLTLKGSSRDEDEGTYDDDFVQDVDEEPVNGADNFEDTLAKVYMQHVEQSTSRPNSGGYQRPQTASRTRPSSGRHLGSSSDGGTTSDDQRVSYNAAISNQRGDTDSESQTEVIGRHGNFSDAEAETADFKLQQEAILRAESLIRDLNRPVVKKLKKKKVVDRPRTAIDAPSSKTVQARAQSAVAGSRKNLIAVALGDPDNEPSSLRSKLTDATDLDAAVAKNRSREYLRRARERKEAEDKALALAVDKGRREFEFDCLVKMGEANEICQVLNLRISYRAYKIEDGDLRCHVYENNGFSKEITLDTFQREWRRLKRKLESNTAASSQLQRSRHGVDAVPVGRSTLNGSMGAKGGKKVRQDELKQVLLETMQLTNKLKEQLMILERKGGKFSPYV
eukprot:GILK01002324.1.p1 GENE.GILK01002324.1~~GILK01002324.1.p1  ORF type:complete len:395 (+),score=79.29 GILK01002324.1:1535-2719(+)